jgi:hypothetical protein
MTARCRHARSRRQLLVGCSAALALGWVLTARAVAVPPPMYTRHTEVVLLSAADLKPRHRLIAHAGQGMPVRTPVFSPDGKLVACAGGPSHAGVWDVATGKPVGKLGGGYALAFHGAAEVVGVTVDGFSFTNPTDWGECFAWSHERKDPTTLFRYRLQIPIFSPEGGFLGGRLWVPQNTDRRRIQIVSIPEGKEFATLPDDNAFLGILPGAKHVITGSWPTKRGQPWTMRAWDVKAARVVAEVQGFPLELGSIHARVAVSADGQKVALLGPDLGEVVVWNPTAGTTTRIRHRHAELSAVGFSADGKRMATAGPRTVQSRTLGVFTGKVPQVVTVWDLASAREVASTEVGDVRMSWLTFSPDGTLLLAAGSEDVLENGPPIPGR